MSCECINIKHKVPCREPAKYRCKECGDRLCTACSKKHHAHDITKMEPIK